MTLNSCSSCHHLSSPEIPYLVLLFIYSLNTLDTQFWWWWLVFSTLLSSWQTNVVFLNFSYVSNGVNILSELCFSKQLGGCVLCSRWNLTSARLCCHTWSMMSYSKIHMNLGGLCCLHISEDFSLAVLNTSHRQADQQLLQVQIQVFCSVVNFSALEKDVSVNNRAAYCACCTSGIVLAVSMWTTELPF